MSAKKVRNISDTQQVCAESLCRLFVCVEKRPGMWIKNVKMVSCSIIIVVLVFKY